MEELKRQRLATNKTQEELANEVGIPRTKYARYELGTSEPNIETLKQLADYFHTTIDQIVGHEVPYLVNKAKYSAEQLAVLAELEKLDKEQCYALLAFIEGMKSGKEQQNKILARFHREADEE